MVKQVQYERAFGPTHYVSIFMSRLLIPRWLRT